ncbi:hypothetical protein D039_2343B, partial [Vibrio parahaemolyticus EKP-028]
PWDSAIRIEADKIDLLYIGFNTLNP